MAPDETLVQWQTDEILKYLFEDDHEVQLRRFDCIETDSPAGCSDDFDPVAIADKMREVADALNDDVAFRAALNELRNAAVQEAAVEAFSHGVEALCQTQVAQSAEVASEIQLIRAAAALGLYVIKSSPDLKSKVQSAMSAFFRKNVRTWVKQQGGWEKVKM